ncbi:MAG: RDD family protein [Rubricoccaceae bacterium]|nr:RDD family protein [Rubricoccaceae bacterium]
METPSDPPMADTSSGKADLGKRFGATLIDGLIAGILAYIFALGGIRMYGFGMLVGVAYILVKDGLAVDFMQQQSLGKKLLKLRAVRLDGATMTLTDSVRRNWPMTLASVFYGLGAMLGGYSGFFLFSVLAGLGGLFALVECILVLTDPEGRRFGDKFAETKVIEEAA